MYVKVSDPAHIIVAGNRLLLQPASGKVLYSDAFFTDFFPVVFRNFVPQNRIPFTP
jgi:hypothetical protein